MNMRYRALDAMPFSTEISSNIEMWHWVKTKVNYAMTAFWYARPGTESNVAPDIEMVQNPVAMKSLAAHEYHGQRLRKYPMKIRTKFDLPSKLGYKHGQLRTRFYRQAMAIAAVKVFAKKSVLSVTAVVRLSTDSALSAILTVTSFYFP